MSQRGRLQVEVPYTITALLLLFHIPELDKSGIIYNRYEMLSAYALVLILDTCTIQILQAQMLVLASCAGKTEAMHSANRAGIFQMHGVRLSSQQ